MTVNLNSSGMPKGTGSLQIRGRVYWAIYTDEAGRKLQVNTEMTELADARRVLASAAITVLQMRLAKLREIRDEAPTRDASARSSRDRYAARDSRSRANGKEPAKAAGTGGTHPRERSARKGEAA